MKNIHILPTDKPSCKLQKTKHGNFFLSNEIKLYSDCINQNIYITSDEEIKEGDFVVQINFEKTNTQVIKCETEFQTKIANSKDGSFSKNKIILTTDGDLIKDGVQAIDDEFLEWFVKNPSCEKVEVEEFTVKVDLLEYKTSYKIIIPKEDPKQDWQPIQGEQVWIKVFSNWSKGIYIGYDILIGVHMVREPEEGGGNLLSSNEILPYKAMPNESKKETLEEYAYKNPVYSREEVLDLLQKSFPDKAISGVFNISASKQIYSFEQSLRELGKSNAEKIMKQETLEEAAENYSLELLEAKTIQPHEKTWIKSMFVHIARSQRERMYSEEEVLEIIRQYALEEHLITSSKPDIWFEQFKKK